ncbi:MAG: hypothetical protein OXH75_15500, partial [Acidobacteria bacterium]|nr:hypothetical protein [Acidobacteriota bacterium]
TLVVAMAAGLVLLLALAAAAAPAGGQGRPAPESYTATTPLEADLQRELVSTCGDCPHKIRP